MNILSIDVVIHILSFIDAESLLLSMTINKIFAIIVNKIIKDALRNDIIYYIFRIKTLSIATLRKYLQQITDDAEIPRFHVSSIFVDNKDFILEIINAHIKRQMEIELHNNIVRSNFNFCGSYFYLHNVFFNLWETQRKTRSPFIFNIILIRGFSRY